MKKLILILCCFYGFQVKAQSDYSKFDVNLGLSTNLYQKQFQPSLNLQGELHLNAHWSLLYNYNIGALRPTDSYLHAPMSLFAVGPVTRFLSQNSYTFSDFLGSLFVGALTACIPEGLAYHYPLAYRYDLSGYVNPLGLAIVFSDYYELDERVRYNTNAGVKLTYYSRFGVLANVHAQLNYMGYYGFYPSAGFSLGYAIGHRKIGS